MCGFSNHACMHTIPSLTKNQTTPSDKSVKKSNQVKKLHIVCQHEVYRHKEKKKLREYTDNSTIIQSHNLVVNNPSRGQQLIHPEKKKTQKQTCRLALSKQIKTRKKQIEFTNEHSNTS